MAKKKPTKEESAYMGRISMLPCSAFGCGGVEVHHVRNNTGMGCRPSHFDTIALCVRHHRGEDGIHTIGKKTWSAKYGSELDMLEETKRKMKGF